MSRDVLGDHDCVVDHEADRDRHGAQGHQVERLAEELHDEHGDGERQRDGRRADRSDPPVAEKHEQHEDGERGADEHRIAHRTHGLTNQLRLIVDRLHVNARRQRWRDRIHDARDAVRDRQRIAAELPGDVDERGGPAVAGDDAHVVFGAELNRRDVAHVQTAAHYDVADVVDGVSFLIGHDQILPIVLRHATHSLHRDRPANRVGQIAVAQPMRREQRGVGDDFQFAHIRPLYVDAANTGNARYQRLDVVAREIVQPRRLTAFDVVGEDWK